MIIVKVSGKSQRHGKVFKGVKKKEKKIPTEMNSWKHEGYSHDNYHDINEDKHMMIIIQMNIFQWISTRSWWKIFLQIFKLNTKVTLNINND